MVMCKCVNVYILDHFELQWCFFFFWVMCKCVNVHRLVSGGQPNLETVLLDLEKISGGASATIRLWKMKAHGR